MLPKIFRLFILMVIGLGLVGLGPEARPAAAQENTASAAAQAEIRQLREDLADQNAAIDRLMSQIAELKGELEELKYQLRSGGGTGGGAQDLERRLARIEARIGLQASQTTPPTGGPVTTAPGGSVATGPGPTTQPPALTEDEAFARAKGLYKQGQMEQARGAFRKFVDEFPASNKVPAAKFWTGETFYYQRRFEEAILEYQNVIDNHPKSGKVASALLKQAFAFAEIKDPTSARITLQKLIKKYPKTQQAVIAKRKLASLKK